VAPVNKMEPNENSEPKCYNSTYQHGVDEKRRVQIPAKWRPAQAGTELTLVPWPHGNEGSCIRVLPPQKLDDLMRKTDAMPSTDPRKVPFKRFIGSESVQVTLDKAGRICVPEEMARSAGISDTAVLVGLLDRFEIWNPERYQKVKTSDAIIAQEAFQMME
jgi:transcriptional regulator MraZ